MVEYLEDGSAKNRKPYAYRSASVNVGGSSGDTDITSITGFETLFDAVKRAHYIKIEASGTAYFTLNAITNDIITITATTPYTNESCVVDKIFASTGGAGVTVTINIH